MRADFLLLCEAADIDDEGRPSLIRIADVIRTPSLPVRFRRLAIAAQLHGVPGQTYSVQLTLRDPAGNDLYEAHVTRACGPSGALAIAAPIEDAVLEQVGVHMIAVAVDGEEVAQAEVLLSVVPLTPESLHLH